jgi:hypothetical protein
LVPPYKGWFRMNKDELKRLQIYKAKVKDMLAAGVPDKHKNNPETYLAYLRNELKLVELAIERVMAI